jgi:hypothetical protein
LRLRVRLSANPPARPTSAAPPAAAGAFAFSAKAVSFDLSVPSLREFFAGVLRLEVLRLEVFPLEVRRLLLEAACPVRLRVLDADRLLRVFAPLRLLLLVDPLFVPLGRLLRAFVSAI